MRVGMMEDIIRIRRVGRKEGEVEKGEVLLVELVSFHHLIIVFLRNSLMLNIPRALLMRRPITFHGAFGAYANPQQYK